MSEPQPNNGAAVDFLRRWAPEGPWVLTAIRPDRKAITTATFYPDGEVYLRKWLDEYNGQRNVYFHVNSPTHDLTKKAYREDIKSVDWFHVDIDPRAGEDLAEEQAIALGKLTDKLPGGVPAPTVVIFSGGGYQGFWKLEEPIPIDGDLPKAEDAKRYNQWLETLFGADTYALKQVATARHEVEIAQGQFTLNEKGVPLPSQHNIRVALYRMGFKLRYDTFADRALIDGLPGHGPTLQDESVVAIYLKVEERFKFLHHKTTFRADPNARLKPKKVLGPPWLP